MSRKQCKPISQRQARRYKKRVEALEQVLRNERHTYAQEYKGTFIGTIAHEDVTERLAGKLRTANLLGHKIVAVTNADNDSLKLMALPHPGLPA